MTPKVSVVIPVWNPGRFIDRCLDSLLAQTMPATDFEVLFMDDGSTDGTEARLDRLAAKYPHFIVHHLENSGWPGKPRNVGIERANGEYVQFVDNDDALGPEALERLYAIGARNNSDIVIGKVVSDFRGVPHVLFRTTRDRCTVRDAPLFESLTPHQDVPAAVPAGQRHPLPRGQASPRGPADHGPGVLPGEEREHRRRLHLLLLPQARGRDERRLHPYRSQGLLREPPRSAGGRGGEHRAGRVPRLHPSTLLPGRDAEPGGRRAEVSAVLPRADTDRGPDVDGRPAVLPGGVHRAGRGPARPRVLRPREPARRPAHLHRTVQPNAQQGTAGEHALAGRPARPDSAGVVHLQRRAARAGPEGDRLFLPHEIALDAPPEDRECTGQLAEVRADASIKNRDTPDEYFLPTDLQMTQHEVTGAEGNAVRAEWVGEVRVDPRSAFGGSALPRGVWDFSVRLTGLGVSLRARLGRDRSIDSEQGAYPALLAGSDRQLVAIPYWTRPYGNLSLDIDQFNQSLKDALGGARTKIAPRWGRSPGRLRLTLPLAVQSARPVPGSLRLIERRTVATLDCPLETSHDAKTLRLSAVLPARGVDLTPGSWDIALTVPDVGWTEPVRIGRVIEVPKTGPMRVRPDPRLRKLRRLRILARETVREIAQAARQGRYR